MRINKNNKHSSRLIDLQQQNWVKTGKEREDDDDNESASESHDFTVIFCIEKKNEQRSER